MTYKYDPSGAPVDQTVVPEGDGADYSYLAQLLPLIQQQRQRDAPMATSADGGTTPYDVAMMSKTEEEEQEAKIRKHDPLAYTLPQHKIVNNIPFMKKLQGILPF